MVGRRNGDVLLGFPSRSSKVRRHDHPRVGHERREARGLLGENVQRRAGHPLFFQSVEQGCLIDDPPSSAVDDPDPRLGAPQDLLSNEPFRAGGGWNVNGEEVDLRRELAQIADQLHVHLFRHAWRDVRVKGHDLHAKAIRHVDHVPADLPEPDNAKSFPSNLDADELLPLPLPLLHGGAGLREIPGQGK